MARPSRPLLTLGLPLGGLAVAGAFVAGLLAADPGAPASSPGPAEPGRTVPRGDAIPVAWRGDALAPTDSCDALLQAYVERGAELVGPWGWGGRPVVYAEGMLSMPLATRDQAMIPGAGPTLVAGAAPAMSRAQGSATGTNVQEAAVDEPDVVKTDGSLLVRVEDGDDLVVADVSGARVHELAEVDLPDVEDAELLLAGDRVVVVGRTGDGTSTRVLRYDLAEPAAPELVDSIAVDSGYVAARLHGSVVRVVAQAGLPDLDFVQPRGGRGDGVARSSRTATEMNVAAVRETTLADWLPSMTTYDVDSGEPTATEPLLDCDEVAVPTDDDGGLGTASVIGFDVDDDAALRGPGGLDARAVAVGGDLVYVSADHLYVAASPEPFGWCCAWPVAGVDGVAGVAGPRGLGLPVDGGTTHVHDFELSGTSATYVASGDVEGTVADRWSMDEHDGVLRLAVGPSSETADANAVVTLRREGDELVEVGRLDRLGVHERIQSVRWFDDLAIVVTFRQVDPLYAVDLSEPARPTVAGKLKIPGFSEYLHPLGPSRLLGFGQGPVPRPGGGRPSWGARTALFDVSDLADPRRISVLDYRPRTQQGVASDPRQLAWLPETRTALTVVDRGRSGFVSVVDLADGAISDRLVRVEAGSDVSDVRVVPLPDGRVVLVTGDGARFFTPLPGVGD